MNVMTYESFRALKYFPGLDGIRAICALAVLIENSQGAVGVFFLRFGALGVDMFFVISGFLIVTLLLRERDKIGAVNLKGFYARRVLRIFPIYYLLIGLYLLCYLIVSPWKPRGLASYLPASWVLAQLRQFAERKNFLRGARVGSNETFAW
jgi:peptidoglycan/LPS O-acetylase OafA/YrhL